MTNVEKLEFWREHIEKQMKEYLTYRNEFLLILIGFQFPAQLLSHGLPLEPKTATDTAPGTLVGRRAGHPLPHCPYRLSCSF